MNTVALPIEEQVNGVEHMIYMQSTSASDGTYSLIVTFDIGTDLNFAQVLVQNRLASAMAALPQAVQTQGVNVQQKSTAILGIVLFIITFMCVFAGLFTKYSPNQEIRIAGVRVGEVKSIGLVTRSGWLA